MHVDYMQLILAKDDQDETMRRVDFIANGKQAEEFKARILKAWEAE